MPDLQTRLPDLLRRAAGRPQRDPGFERRTLRRARRRRALNASAAGLAAIALVAGAVLGARGLVLSNRTSPAVSPSPSPGTVMLVTYLPDAVWPEVTEAALEASQAQADADELAWRLDPVQTAVAFATGILHWDAADVRAEEVGRPRIGTSLVRISNLGLGPADETAGPAAPETLLTLKQLGETGDRGVWSVVGADSDRILLDPVPDSIQAGSTLAVGGPLNEVWVEWTAALELLIVDPSDGTLRTVPGEPSEMAAGAVRVPWDALGTVSVVVKLFDPEGTTVAADIVPITVEASASPILTGATGPSGTTGPVPTGSIGPGQEIPSAVLSTRDLIAIAAETRDYDALEALVDPDHFSYNFDDGSNPVPEWRKDPAALDTLVTILQLSFTTTEGTADVGTIYIWPSLVAADLTNLTDDQRTELEILGITERDVQGMLDAFGRYVGPRTGIAEDGTWLFYTIGGD